MLVIRSPQLASLALAGDEQFEIRMAQYVQTDFPSSYRQLGEAGVHGLLQAVIEEGRSWRIESEGAVAVLLQLTLMFGPRFERSPDARWAQTLIANTTVPESLRMQMIRDRLAARTQGRSVVRHPASE